MVPKVFYEPKCSSLHLDSTYQKLEYMMNLEVLGDTRNEKDMGVIPDQDLKFQAHVSQDSEQGITTARADKNQPYMSEQHHSAQAVQHNDPTTLRVWKC